MALGAVALLLALLLAVPVQHASVLLFVAALAAVLMALVRELHADAVPAVTSLLSKEWLLLPELVAQVAAAVVLEPKLSPDQSQLSLARHLRRSRLW